MSKPQTTSPDDLMNRTEVAELFGVHRDTILKWVSAGDMPEPIRIRRRNLRWRRGDLTVWIKALRSAGRKTSRK